MGRKGEWVQWKKVGREGERERWKIKFKEVIVAWVIPTNVMRLGRR